MEAQEQALLRKELGASANALQLCMQARNAAEAALNAVRKQQAAASDSTVVASGSGSSNKQQPLTGDIARGDELESVSVETAETLGQAMQVLDVAASLVDRISYTGAQERELEVCRGELDRLSQEHRDTTSRLREALHSLHSLQGQDGAVAADLGLRVAQMSVRLTAAQKECADLQHALSRERRDSAELRALLAARMVTSAVHDAHDAVAQPGIGATGKGAGLPASVAAKQSNSEAAAATNENVAESDVSALLDDSVSGSATADECRTEETPVSGSGRVSVEGESVALEKHSRLKQKCKTMKRQVCVTFSLSNPSLCLSLTQTDCESTLIFSGQLDPREVGSLSQRASADHAGTARPPDQPRSNRSPI